MFDYISDQALRNRLKDIREQIRPILDTEIHHHYTDHSFSHSERVVALASQLIAPIQKSSQEPNDLEMFLLYASCYCHDAGMHWEKVDDSVVLRRSHGALSAQMVRQSVRTSHPLIKIQLNDEDKPDYLARLCEAHSLDVDDSRYAELTQAGPKIRVDLIAGLLRLADILDQSRRRARPEKARILKLDAEALNHWWKHYYVEEIVIDGVNWKVTLWFDFPPVRHKEYAEVIPELVISPIQEEIKKQAEVFARAKLAWLLAYEAQRKPHGTAEEMPDEVFMEMQSEHFLKCEMDAANRRIALASTYEKAQPSLNRILDGIEAQKNQIQISQQVDQLVEVAQWLSRLDGKPGELHVLRQAYATSKKTGDARKQFSVGLRLLKLLLEHDVRSTHAIINELKQITPAANPDAEARMEMAITEARAFKSLYGYKEAANAYSQAIDLTLSRDSLLANTLRSELAELHLLVGELEEARKCAEIVGESNDYDRRTFSAYARAVIVRALCEAMSGAVERADSALVREIERAAEQSRVTDRVRLSSTRAYIYYLSDNLEAALNVLNVCRKEVDFAEWPSLQLMLRENQLACQLALLDRYSDRSFYALRDLKSILHIPEKGEKLLAQAKAAVENDRHYDALPAFWQYVLLGYESGVWSSYREAERSLCIEFCRLGWMDRGIYHAMNALDSKQAENVAACLISSRKADLIRVSLQRVLPHAGLKCHAKVVADFVASLGDTVPEDHIDALLRFLIPHATTEFVPRGVSAVSQMTWNALGRMVPLLSAEQADSVVAHILSLNISQTDSRLRSEILKCLWNVLHQASHSTLPSIVDSVLPLATSCREDEDYVHVLNILCHIASTVGGDVKRRIGDALFPEGKPIGSVHLFEIIPVFDKGFSKGSILDNLVSRACHSVRNQVQTFSSENKENREKPVGTHGFLTLQRKEGGETIIYIGGDMELFALIAHKDVLSPNHIKQLSASAIQMILCPENLVPNKISLCRAVEMLSPVIPPEILDDIWKALSAAVRGDVAAELSEQFDREAENPLNPFKMKMGKMMDLRAQALFTLGQIEKHHCGSYGDGLMDLIDEVSQFNDSTARTLAFFTFREVSQISEGLLVRSLWALRDPNIHVASAAFGVFAHKTSISLDSFRSSLLLEAIRDASNSPHSLVRASAAAALTSLRKRIPAGDPRIECLDELLENFREDISFAVRREIAGTLD